MWVLLIILLVVGGYFYLKKNKIVIDLTEPKENNTSTGTDKPKSSEV
jgi:hypothetical protein